MSDVTIFVFTWLAFTLVFAVLMLIAYGTGLYVPKGKHRRETVTVRQGQTFADLVKEEDEQLPITHQGGIS